MSTLPDKNQNGHLAASLAWKLNILGWHILMKIQIKGDYTFSANIFQ